MTKRTSPAAIEAERRVSQALVTQSKTLDLSDLGLSSLPKSLGKLIGLRALYLHGNPSLGLPPQMLGPTKDDVEAGRGEPNEPQVILDFYAGQRKKGAKPLNAVKLLLVGRGRVGKTSLGKALRRLPHNLRERVTRGIERHPVALKGRTIKGYLWDFGGQEFLHQTHQFFFSERSIYLVVLDGRQAAPMQEAEYWLRLIRSYGQDSRVVIVLNRIKKHAFTIDEYFLQETYPEVAAVVRTDCNPRYGIRNLRKVLANLAFSMPSVRIRIDPAWVPIQAYLDRMKESYLTFDRYQEICRKFGVTETIDQENLATTLNYLGILLNYRHDPRLYSTSVLKPRWLVDGIYGVLRQLEKAGSEGEMSLRDFGKVLKDKKIYPPQTHGFLLALMEKFELCFPIDGKKNRYLIPGLLDEHQPQALKRFMAPQARRIQFRYKDIRPPGLMPRFIVRSSTLSDGQPRWRQGVVLKRGDASALIRADHEGRVTDVFALGRNENDRVGLTEFILSEMRALNDNLPVSTHVEDEEQPGVWAELDILREALRRNEMTRTERPIDGAPVMVNVLEQVRAVESLESVMPTDYPPLPLFICYARANEREIKPFSPSLKLLGNRKYIAPWLDSYLVPGDDWNEEIQRRLTEARIILFMVSREFLVSDYIIKHERPLAMQLRREGKAIVVPVLLGKCTWEEEDFKELEMLPHKNRPVSSFRRPNDAWFLVEDGLMRTVKKARNSKSLNGSSVTRFV